MIKVVCALIKKDNKILLARRKNGDEQVIGKWEFPGGKVNDGEKEEEAIEREVKEELEIIVRAKKIVTSNIYRYQNKVIDLRLYRCDYVKGKIKLHDHLEYVWTNSSNLLDYDLAPADINLAKFIMNSTDEEF